MKTLRSSIVIAWKALVCAVKGHRSVAYITRANYDDLSGTWHNNAGYSACSRCDVLLDEWGQ